MDFEKALQTNDSNFESILEIMKLRNIPEHPEHPEHVDSVRIDSVRNMLLTVNIIIDFFMNREDDKLRIPVVYFPICTDYAQEMCEDFVVLKMGLYTNKEWKNIICTRLNKDYLYVTSEIKTALQKQALRENYKYEKTLSKILSRSINEYADYGKSLIYSERLRKDWDCYIEANRSYNRKSVNKYWYLRHAINEFKGNSKTVSPLSFVSLDSEEFYNNLIEYGDTVSIQNIVVFPYKSPDGRYSDFCADSFQKPYLDDFVNSGCGLKNVFFFCFSRKPYRLRRLFDFKQRMKERIQIFDDESLEFISFTYDESLALFGQKGVNQLSISVGKDSNEIQEDYETLFDDITNGLDRFVSRRNEMSICFNKLLFDKYCPKLVAETETDETILSEIFKFNNQIWKNEADTVLRHFVYDSDIFIVTGNDVDENLKSIMANVLKESYSAKKVLFGTFGDLRGRTVDGIYMNDIECNKIIVMSFRSDYTDSIFHKYPNSFDPYCINQNQQLLEISNYFYLRQYYDWGRYNYGKAIRKILRSEFRSTEMRPNLVEYKRPIKRLPDDTREAESDRNTNRAVKKTKVYYQDGRCQEFGKSEWMLYKHGVQQGIAPLSDLYDLYNSDSDNSDSDISIQPLSSLVKRVYTQCVDAEKEKDSRSERMFKEQPSYGLTQEEINSDVQLWKILLSRRVSEHGCRNVFEDVMSNFNERYKVSYFSFKRWLEPDYGIPRARKVQKFLIEDYLGIRPPYINLVRRIKERTKSDTEEITISIRHFLNIALLSNNYSVVYSALSDEIRDLLDINNPTDVENIVKDVKERINYERVKTIKQ